MPEPKEMQAYAARVAAVPEFARKLLAHVVELAYAPHKTERARATAYLPELHETCGLDVDAMYALLGKLEDAGLIEIEGEYPFQDVKLRDREQLDELVRRAGERGVSPRQVLVESRFDLLD